MQLTAELFEELLSCVRADRKAAKDTRQTPRIELAATLVMQRLNVGQTNARVRDISANGICLVVPRPIPLRERIVVQLPRTRGTPLTLILETIRCEEVADGIYYLETQVLNGEGIHLSKSKKPDKGATPV